MSLSLLRFCICAVVLLVDVNSATTRSRDKYPYYPASLKSSSSSNNDSDAASSAASSASVYYDQRQNGKYNINVNIKDVAIISIDPETLAANVGVNFRLLFNLNKTAFIQILFCRTRPTTATTTKTTTTMMWPTLPCHRLPLCWVVW